MEGIRFIQDLAVVLLAAGVAGGVCKRLGLSVIVGYLAAGVIIGPFTPPFSFILDVERIQTLSQLGLVFLMFGIGLGLSLTKLGKLGVPTLVATGLGAFFMLNLTQLLGLAVGWDAKQSLFVAGMFMASSSAVIAKIVGELNLGHERSAQRALGITVMEDVVAVVMLTILGSQATPSASAGGVAVGSLLGGLTAFVVLLLGGGLLLVPRLLRRLEAKADPELQTIMVAGVLFLLALAAARAGYSLALGAFLLGAIVAEMPQRVAVERAFGGMRDLFSSVFFVAIGMLIDPVLLASVWPWILGLGVFAIVGRSLATGLALIVVGTPPAEARRAGLLLAPLGEFTFIIAQLGVGAAILPAAYYPMAVGVSLVTVLVTPLINRRADVVVRWAEAVEPAFLQRALEAYHGWLRQASARPAPPLAWKLTRSRLMQIAVEMLFVTGLLTFSEQLQTAITGVLGDQLDVSLIPYFFWALVGVLVLVPLVAIWRNVSAVAMIAAECFGASTRLPPRVIHNAVKALGLVVLGRWLHAILPFESLSVWGWVVIAVIALAVVAFYSNRLIYWHSSWQSQVRDVLAEDAATPADVRAQARVALGEALEGWRIRLGECVIPDGATCAGQRLAELSIPTRFGSSVVEVERNGYVITTTGPDLVLYPGDKVLLLGRADQIAATREALGDVRPASNESDEFRGSVLETVAVASSLRAGRSLAELQVPHHTGVRVVGIDRQGRQIIHPSANETLEQGDHVLALGTLTELRRFRHWVNAN